MFSAEWGRAFFLGFWRKVSANTCVPSQLSLQAPGEVGSPVGGAGKGERRPPHLPWPLGAFFLSLSLSFPQQAAVFWSPSSTRKAEASPERLLRVAPPGCDHAGRRARRCPQLSTLLPNGKCVRALSAWVLFQAQEAASERLSSLPPWERCF